MGLNIGLELNKQDHPDWDSGRQGHDVEFLRLFDNIETIKHPEAKGFLFGMEITGYEYHIRPKNIDELRDKIKETDWEFKDRYYHLCDLLEADENCWVYISY